MRKIVKKSLIYISIAIVIICISTTTKAASFSLSANKKTVTIGDNFQITISGIYGKVTVSSNNNVQLSQTGSLFVDGSLSITGTAKTIGTGTITVKPVDVVTTGANPQEVTSSKSMNITINQKVVTPTVPETPKKEEKKPTMTTTKKENKKVEKVEETHEQEEATPPFGINTITINAITQEQENQEISLDKIFDLNQKEYHCQIPYNITKLEITYDAGIYQQYVTIQGTDNLIVGENKITLTVKKEEQEVVYTIYADKEEPVQISSETKSNNQDKGLNITLPLGWFIVLELVIIFLTIILTKIGIDAITKRKNKIEKD